MPIKCTASFREIAFFDDESVAELRFFWRDTKTKQDLFSVIAKVAIPIAMKNTDDIKVYALQKAKELISGAADAKYEP